MIDTKTMPTPPDRLKVGDAFPFIHRIQVRLDGQLQKYVLEYCISEGWVKRIKVHEDGKIVVCPAGDDYERETIRGQVTVDYAKED